MSAAPLNDLLARLQRAGIRVWLEGSRLKYAVPAGSDHELILGELRSRKAEVQELLGASDGARTAKIERLERSGPLPLSFAQERLWFLTEFQGASAAATYNMCGALAFSGQLHRAAIEASLQEVVRRHETLRSRIVASEGRPSIVIEPPESFRVRFEDLSELGQSSRAAVTERLLAEETARPFELETSTGFRARLVAFGETEHVLLLNMHHVFGDAWSLANLVRELKVLYSAYSRGDAGTLDELDVQYVDYAAWQRAHRDPATLETQLGFWRERLEGLPPLLTLPTDRPRPSVQTHRGDSVPVRWNEEMTAQVNQLARTLNASPYMVLLSCFSALLSRYSGQTDIGIGSPVSNRSIRETTPLIGLFVNTLVMRVHHEAEDDFKALCGRVKDFTLGALAHQDVPFEQIVDAVQPERSLAHTPLFQALLIVQNAPDHQLELPGLEIQELEAPHLTAKFDLTLSLGERDGRYEGFLEFNSDLFDRGTIERFGRHLERFVHAVAESPDRCVADVPLVTDEERQAQRAMTRGTTQLALPQTSPEQFVARARECGSRVAVTDADRTLTYDELAERATELAARLRAVGIASGDRVALCMPRGVSLIVALQAIHLAGAAYVPVDPDWPEARRRFVLEDSGAVVLLTNGAYRGGIPEGCRNVDVAAAAERSRAVDIEAPAPESLAYVIYTSGSTGRPKGVEVEHRQVANFFAGMDEVLRPTPGGKWLALTTIAFDISVLEILWALSRGFEVVLQKERESFFANSVGRTRALDVGLFYFSSNDAEGAGEKYDLLLRGAQFADQQGFAAVWTPERHFHEFGGIFPNPSLAAAALAVTTKRVQLRAGSVVLPLHHPLRVAEEWSVVDNLSGGRVGVSFASGWQADDFVLAPENYEDRKRRMVESIDQVRRLWRGEKLRFKNGRGDAFEAASYPRPVQPELPIWVTAAGSEETFRAAGALGANLLTHLLGQELDDLAQKIQVYRAARAAHGFDPETGVVSLMLHTFVGDDDAAVRELVREPMCNYLRSSLDLLGNVAKAAGLSVKPSDLGEQDLHAVLQHAFERYYEHNSLLGSHDRCLSMLDRIVAIGVDEVAALIDFGLPGANVLDALHDLAEVTERHARSVELRRADMSIAAQIERHGVTHMQVTPSLARMLLADAASRAALTKLEVLVVGGEELTPSLASELCSVMTGRLINAYGPTETTVWSSTHEVASGEAEIPLGRPLVNTDIEVLDSRGRPVPFGVVGEVYIGGLGVARGYRSREDLTRERFVTLETPEGAQRFYRTGDLGSFSAEGKLRFFGRADNQVKVRGFRIELGEIEAVLDALPGVSESAVVARSKEGDTALVAYVVLEPGVSADAVRDALRAALPGYMVPSRLVAMEFLPRNSSGKLDRKALPEAGFDEPASTGSVAPRTTTELKLLPIWESVLGAKNAGVTDSFFDLGGHSLLAVRLLSEVEKKMGPRLPLATLFKAPTIEQMARIIDEGSDAGESDKVTVLVHPGVRGEEPIFMVPGAGGNLIYFHDLVRHMSGRWPVYGFQAAFLDETIHNETIVETMATRFLEEVRRIQPHGPRRLVGHSFGGQVVFEMARQLKEAGEDVELVAILDSPAPVEFDEPLRKHWDFAQWVAFIGKIIRRLYGNELGLVADELRPLSREDQVRQLMRRMQEYHLLPPDYGLSRMFGFVELFKADHMSTYSPDGKYPDAITLFRARELHPDNVPSEEMRPTLEDSALGWRPFTKEVRVFDVPGDHLTLMREPHVRVVAEILEELISGSAKTVAA